MRYLVLLYVLTALLIGAVYDIRTNDLSGRVVIQYGDTLILHPNHHLVGNTPDKVNVVLCETLTCREEFISYISHRYRTNGIIIEEIR